MAVSKEQSGNGATGPSPDGRAARAPRRRIKLSPTAWIGVVIVSIMVFIAVFGPLIAPYSESDMLPDGSFASISAEHWLGTDYIGRDVFSRILYGARVTLGLSFLATLLAFTVGTFFGLTAATSRPFLDAVISRFYDIVLSIPSVMLALVAIAALGTSATVLIGTIGLIYSSNAFRISRALAMDIKVMDFVEAARARGEGRLWIITREIWPNAMVPLLSELGLRLAYSILAISALSFLGLGVQPPTAGWGVMVRENMTGMMFGAPAALAPAFTIALLTISINLIVDDISSKYGRDISEAPH
ncbi:MAG: ABC transporter permease [Arenicellales bacterium]